MVLLGTAQCDMWTFELISAPIFTLAKSTFFPFDFYIFIFMQFAVVWIMQEEVTLISTDLHNTNYSNESIDNILILPIGSKE